MLTDEYAVKILVATTRKPRSAQEISQKYGIPIAACYRRIRDLQSVGLLECKERKLSQQGKRISYYLSTLKNAYLFFENGKLRVKFQLKTGDTDQFGDQWHDIEFKPDEEQKDAEEDKR
ncbi:MAG: winged helix-turn-helix transcriptional regulator [Methanomassiliicoccales archaeon]|nr:winged helix-turn-helix transcriptional regulator [Methanomassiliicoccales archaeon]